MPQERARRSIEFCLGRLRLQAEELRSEQYPGNHPGPRHWLDLVNGLLDTADSYLDLSRTASDVDQAAALARDAARLGSMAYQCMYLMQGSSVAHLSPPITIPFQRWLDTLGFPNTAIFRAETVVNYELFRQDEKPFTRIRNPAPTLVAAIAALKWPLFRITLPTKGFAILPHFAIVAHEIGHALCDRLNWDLSAFAPEEKPLIDRVQAKLGHSLTPESLTFFQKVFLHWFHELAADAFAFFLTGPAIFFSLCDFFQLLGNGYGLTATHPANDLRRRAIYKQLVVTQSKDSFVSVFQKHAGLQLDEAFNSGILIPAPPKSDIWSDTKNSGATDFAAAILSELHESVELLVPMIYHQAREHLRAVAPQTIYSPEAYDEDLNTHLQAMLAAIPPIESVQGAELTAARFASILNVGWVALLTKFDEFRIAGEGAGNWERMEVLHSLLEKAVELSEVKRLWESVP